MKAEAEIFGLRFFDGLFSFETVRFCQFIVNHKLVIFIPCDCASDQKIYLLSVEMMLHQYHYDDGYQMDNPYEKQCKFNVLS